MEGSERVEKTGCNDTSVIAVMEIEILNAEC